MPRAQVIQIADKYGGTGPFYSDLHKEQPPYDWRSDGDLEVWFADFETFCISGGKAYSFYFRPDWTLMEWKVHDWSNAC